MSEEIEQESPEEVPEALTEDEAVITTEFPVVVLGEAGEGGAPRTRLLQGRVPQGWVMYPTYLMVTIAGAVAVDFSLGSSEWSVIPVTLGWAMLYLWYWFYGVAYRYRRGVLKFASLVVVFGMTWALALMCEDRAMVQVVALDNVLVEREDISQLHWAATLTWVATLGVVAHVLFLGRGYREKHTKGAA